MTISESFRFCLTFDTVNQGAYCGIIKMWEIFSVTFEFRKVFDIEVKLLRLWRIVLQYLRNANLLKHSYICVKKLSAATVWEAVRLVVDNAVRLVKLTVNRDWNALRKFSAFAAYSSGFRAQLMYGKRWITLTTRRVKRVCIRNRNTELSKLNNQNGDLKFIHYCNKVHSIQSVYKQKHRCC